MNDDKPIPDLAYLEGDIGHHFHKGGHSDAFEFPALVEVAKCHLD
jgi:hypothetical protein